jgi:hypothetical protein
VRWVRPTSSCGCGRSPRTAGWSLRGPRGDPPAGGDAGLEVLPTDRHPTADLPPLAGQRPADRPGEGAVAGPGRGCGGGGGGQVRRGLAGLGASQDLRSDARGRAPPVGVQCGTGDAPPWAAALFLPPWSESS